MNYDRTPVALCTLALALATAACGDKNTVSDAGTEPRQCAFGTELYEDGDEFGDAAGCLRYECVDGTVEVLADDRITIAGDLELPTQEAVDQQTCLGVVEGTLRITGTAADMSPLGQLYRVGTDLEITATEAVSLAGMGALAEIGGSIVIADNAQLTTMAFQPYMSVFGDVTIQNNDALASLAGAEFIGQCAACASVSGRPSDVIDAGPSAGGGGTGGNGDGGGAPAGDGAFDEPQGGTFYGNILIADNDVLTDLFAMSNLYFAWADLRLRNNAALTSLGALSVMQVQGDLEITDHAAMPTSEADAFALGITVSGTTTICGNLDGAPCP